MDKHEQMRSETEETGALIRRLRKAAGMTQEKLSEKMGISYQQVQKYEKGISELTMRRLKQIAGALNVLPDVLLLAGANGGGVKGPVSGEDLRVHGLLKSIEARGLKPLAVGILELMAGEGFQ